MLQTRGDLDRYRLHQNVVKTMVQLPPRIWFLDRLTHNQLIKHTIKHNQRLTIT